MIVKTRNYFGAPLLLAALFILAAPAAGHADNLFRLYPELQVNGFYADNVPLKTSNEIGDFGSTMVGGFFLDFTSAARYASLHYDTFVQLFTHQTQYDRAGEGQYVSLTDDENLSPTTKLHLDELFYRDAPALVAITTSDQSPQFNSMMALLLLANFQASINQFDAQLTHYWGRKWSSELSVHQTTFWATGNNSNGNNGNNSYVQGFTAITDYHFSGRFSLGGGNRYYDFQFTLPGRPDQQADWPFLRATWQPMRNLSLTGMVGVVISHAQGTSGDQVNPAGIGTIAYQFERGEVNMAGGQEPELVSVYGSVGEVRYGRGSIIYDFTQRLTGTAGFGYYDFTGSGFTGNTISWGVGLSERVNKWLSLNTRFIQVRRSETSSSQFLPSGTQSGQWAVGDYYVVGLAVSIEAFRWSWQ
jgi:hypothetical protein